MAGLGCECEQKETIPRIRNPDGTIVWPTVRNVGNSCQYTINIPDQTATWTKQDLPGPTTRLTYDDGVNEPCVFEICDECFTEAWLREQFADIDDLPTTTADCPTWYDAELVGVIEGPDLDFIAFLAQGPDANGTFDGCQNIGRVLQTVTNTSACPMIMTSEFTTEALSFQIGQENDQWSASTIAMVNGNAVGPGSFGTVSWRNCCPTFTGQPGELVPYHKFPPITWTQQYVLPPGGSANLELRRGFCVVPGFDRYTNHPQNVTSHGNIGIRTHGMLCSGCCCS